ncbi:MAG: hypothetical protein MPJ25_16175, partial [Pirellulales bacterium]|nr:hypothetical protein [Pirellulales bacterium]
MIRDILLFKIYDRCQVCGRRLVDYGFSPSDFPLESRGFCNTCREITPHLAKLDPKGTIAINPVSYTHL